jgi:hypothetical protein
MLTYTQLTLRLDKLNELGNSLYVRLQSLYKL